MDLNAEFRSVLLKFVNENKNESGLKTLSEWMVTNSAQHVTVITTWREELGRCHPRQIELFLRLLTQVLRHKDGKEYLAYSRGIIEDAVAAALRNISTKDEEVLNKVHEVVQLWHSREMYGPAVGERLQKSLAGRRKQIEPIRNEPSVPGPVAEHNRNLNHPELDIEFRLFEVGAGRSWADIVDDDIPEYDPSSPSRRTSISEGGEGSSPTHLRLTTAEHLNSLNGRQQQQQQQQQQHLHGSGGARAPHRAAAPTKKRNPRTPNSRRSTTSTTSAPGTAAGTPLAGVPEPAGARPESVAPRGPLPLEAAAQEPVQPVDLSRLGEAERRYIQTLEARVRQLEETVAVQKEELTCVQRTQNKVDEFVKELRVECAKLIQRQLNVERGLTPAVGGGMEGSGGGGFRREEGVTPRTMGRKPSSHALSLAAAAAAAAGAGSGSNASTPRSLNPQARPFVPGVHSAPTCHHPRRLTTIRTVPSADLAEITDSNSSEPGMEPEVMFEDDPAMT